MLRIEALSERQRQVLEGVAAGKSNGVIAGELGITLDGVKWHVSELLGETGLASRQELAEWYRRQTPARAAPAFLPMRLLAHPLAGPAVRVTVVLVLAAAIATGITIAATGGSRPAAVVVPAQQEKLAYVQDGDIWLKDLPDGAPRQLTQRAAGEDPFSAPRWSPSGQWLTFLQAGQPWITRADGGGLRRIEGGAWSPAADRLAYITSDEAVVVENADGSGRQTLAQWHGSPGEDGGLSNLVWKTDGTAIAYVETRAISGTPQRTYAGIWTVPADGSAPPAEVLNGGSPPRDGFGLLAWTRFAALLFYRTPSFTADLADGVLVQELRVGSGPPPTVNDFAPQPLQMLLTPDYWSLAPDQRLVAVTDGGGRETWTGKRIGFASPSSAINNDVTPPDVAAIEPAWSPDGARVAYVATPDAPGVPGGDPAKAAMARRKIWVMDADGANQRQLTADPAYRDEYPRWSADGTRIYFMRLDRQDRWSLWVMDADGGNPRLLIGNLPPDVLTGSPPWFGYYGLISWSGVLDYWRPPASAAASATPGASRTLSLASLGLELQYPAAWTEGAAQEFSTAAFGPVVSCSDCTVLGPPSAQYPSGVEIFIEDLDPGCAVSCYVGNNAVGIGGTPLGPAAQTLVRVADIDAKRMEIQRQAPLGIAAQTGDDTPYREIWTLAPWYGKALFFLAFYREGDASAEAETRAAYEALLASVRRLAPQAAQGQTALRPATVSAGQTISVRGYAGASPTRGICIDALPDMMPASADVPGGIVITCTVDQAAAARLRFVSDGGNVLRLSSVEVLLPATAAPATGPEADCNDSRSTLLPASTDPGTAVVRLACLAQPPARGAVSVSRAEFWAYAARGSSPTAAEALPGSCWELARFLDAPVRAETDAVTVPCWLE